jgi:hypothetical protein
VRKLAYRNSSILVSLLASLALLSCTSGGGAVAFSPAALAAFTASLHEAIGAIDALLSRTQQGVDTVAANKLQMAGSEAKQLLTNVSDLEGKSNDDVQRLVNNTSYQT